jgi:hypothetical protein
VSASGVYGIKQGRMAPFSAKVKTIMKMGRAGMALAVLIFATCLETSDPTTTDARSDGLIGPVRSVSATEETQQLAWGQMSAKTAVWGLVLGMRPRRNQVGKNHPLGISLVVGVLNSP